MDFHCPWCRYTTQWLFTLDHHIQSHKNVAANFGHFSCNEQLAIHRCQCHFHTADESSFLKHLESNCARRFTEYSCPHCPLKTCSSLFLSKHLKQVGYVKPPTYKCPYCKVRMRFKNNLGRHIRHKHFNISKPYNCSLCSYTCRSKGELELHVIRKHMDTTQIEWHNCGQCLYRTKTAIVLRKHIKDKHSDNVYNCTLCSYSTTIWSYFQYHRNKHHGKRYKCDQCNFSAYQPSALVNHKICKHTAIEDVQWVQCVLCPYKAKTVDTMNKHKYRKHNNNMKMFQCASCSYTTNRKFSLRGHLERQVCAKRLRRKR